MCPDDANIEKALAGWRHGDQDAVDDLFRLVYDELRILAGRHLNRRRPGDTLGATALVHEVYLRFAQRSSPDLVDRNHFVASPAAWRYSDEQLYALATYLYSLKPPPNPNKFDALAAHGKEVFTRDGCASCHTPPLYTNNTLTPVDGFEIQRGTSAALTSRAARSEQIRLRRSRRVAARGTTRFPLSKACGTAVRSSTTDRWPRSRTGSIHGGSATITCRPDISDTASRRAP